MDDVDVAVAVDGAVVRRLPVKLFWELSPAVVDFVFVVAFAEDDFRVGLRFGGDGGRGNLPGNGDGSRGGGGGFDEIAAGHRTIRLLNHLKSHDVADLPQS